MSMFAPIALFAYNRPVHLASTLAALKRCPESAASELHVFADGPKEGEGPDELKRIDETRRVIGSIEGFLKVVVEESPTNRGLRRSIVHGVGEVLNSHEEVIVLEDDLLVSPHFLRFMNRALLLNRGHEGVTSVSGYSYNLPFRFLRRTNYYLRTFSCHGWGTWRDRWERIKIGDPELFNDLKGNLWRRFHFNIYGGMDYFRTLQRNREEDPLRVWAIEFWLSQFYMDGIQLFPRDSLVSHLGYDGSGTNCKEENPFNDDEMKESPSVGVFPTRVSVRFLDQLSLALFFFLVRSRLYLRNKLRLRSGSL